MDKYFLIKNTKYDEWVEEVDEKEEVLKRVEGFLKYDDNNVRIIKGKEISLIKKEVVLKYDLDETDSYRAPKVSVRMND